MNWGAGTRASQFLVLGAKARALLAGRSHATFDDIRALANPVLRHRILLNYRAEAEGVKVDDVRIGSVSVTIDETKATVGDLVDAVSDAGYEATEAA